MLMKRSFRPQFKRECICKQRLCGSIMCEEQDLVCKGRSCGCPQLWRFAGFMNLYILIFFLCPPYLPVLMNIHLLRPTSVKPVDVLMCMHRVWWTCTPQDPLETVREKCEQTEHCVHTRERLVACETRVGSHSETTEDCTEELFDFLHARDHCVSAAVLFTDVTITDVVWSSDRPIPIICTFMYPLTDMQNRYLFTVIKYILTEWSPFFSYSHLNNNKKLSFMFNLIFKLQQYKYFIYKKHHQQHWY